MPNSVQMVQNIVEKAGLPSSRAGSKIAMSYVKNHTYKSGCVWNIRYLKVEETATKGR